VIRGEDEQTATALLWECGTSGIEVQPHAGGLALLSYFQDRPGLRRDLDQALAHLSEAHVEPAEIRDVDWVARFRESFRPFQVRGFTIAPAWNVPRVVAGRLLIVDPGRAFGTGTHETTRLCLRALEGLAAARPLPRVVDIGTGSGILAVAAALLGSSCVVAVDNDPEASLAARRHAELNGVSLRVVRGDGGRALAPGSFDVVVANLTATLLQDRCRELASLGAPGATLVLSGLLVEDLPGLRQRYEPLGHVAVETEGEWAALLVSLA
jgi:ribosomal protein L11 methyltransferase